MTLTTKLSAMNDRQDVLIQVPRQGTAYTKSVTRSPNTDGIDHINIDMRAKTELGRSLSHLHRQLFIHPQFGPFQCVEGFIGYIRTGRKDEEFRQLYGMDARHRSRHTESVFVRGFREIVMEANYLKIKQSSELTSAMTLVDLPFDHYFMFTPQGTPVAEREAKSFSIRPKNASWLIPGFETIRTLLRDDTDFPKVDYSGIPEV